MTVCLIFRSCSVCRCCQGTVLLMTKATSYPFPASVTLQMKDIKTGRNKMRSPDGEPISWRTETGERFPSRPLQIPSLLSSAESKMQLTGKKTPLISLLLLPLPSVYLTASFFLPRDRSPVPVLSLYLWHTYANIIHACSQSVAVKVQPD